MNNKGLKTSISIIWSAEDVLSKADEMGIVDRVFENDNIIIYKRKGQLDFNSRYFEVNKESGEQTVNTFKTITQVKAYTKGLYGKTKKV